MMRRVIALIGAPGAGKTTTGQSLAARLGCEFVDVDQLIESQEGRTIPEIAAELGADYLVYQEIGDLKAAILEGSPDVEDLDMSCFDGRYITGTVTDEYLAWVEGTQES